MYAIIDVETTGRSPSREKITEIAIYVHDGERIIDEFVSLVNPERSIPYYITQLTGISNEMVMDAPRFYEIAAKVVKMTENCTFVAHNVHFDYNFIKQEFKEIGYDYERNKLCTIQLSKKLIPGRKSYSLGKICRDEGISLNGHHRAAADAYATTLLFEKLLSINKGMLHPFPLKSRRVNARINRDLTKNLPEKTGVYYFLNGEGDILYIGKSRNIKNRVIAHLNDISCKENELKNRVESIHYEITGSELVALLLESDEIKKHKPLFNRRQRRAVQKWEISWYFNEDHYICFELSMNKTSKPNLIACFNSKEAAGNFLERMRDRHQLCQKLCGLYKSKHSCFHYHIGECRGACIGEEPSETYNSRAEQVLNTKNLLHQNMIILDAGRDESEFSAIKIENGKYHGFGFFDKNLGHDNMELIHDGIKKYGDNHDVQNILKQYLRNHQVHWIITY